MKRPATPSTAALDSAPAAPTANGDTGNVQDTQNAAAAASAKSTRATREDIQKLLDRIGSQIKPESRALNFEINEEIDGVVVSVIDVETEKLVRQIPAEYMVRIAEAMQQYNSPAGNPGLLLEDKA